MLHQHKIVRLLPPVNEVCEGYVFTRVCLSTGGVPGQVPPGQVSPQAGTPQAGTPLGQVHPQGPGTPPQAGAPPGTRYTRSSACWEIRATSGRYASYWNAFLFTIKST